MHTPAPWKFDRSGDDRIVAERVCVALVTRGVDPQCDEQMRGPVFDANARLIAAAPDLLVALKGLVATWDGARDMVGASVRAKLAAADVAIQKAEGR